MTDLLTDRTAIVTGGSSGIGRGIALSLAEHGADVVVADIRREAHAHDVPPTVEVIEDETDARSLYVDCDVTDYEQVDAAVERAAEFGGVDVMVNNAGLVEPAELLEAGEAEYYAMTDVMLKGTFFGCKAAAERMIGRGGGSIINIASTAADQGFPDPSSFFYSAAKGGIKSMTYSLAQILGPDDVRVNSIQPGFTKDTGLSAETDGPEEMSKEEYHRQRAAETALNRLATPEDVGNVAVFLASDLASYVTAADVLVDGGYVNIHGP